MDPIVRLTIGGRGIMFVSNVVGLDGSRGDELQTVLWTT